MKNKKYEIRNCSNGEVNPITKEYWCNAYQEFCTEITNCSVKIFKEKFKI